MKVKSYIPNFLYPKFQKIKNILIIGIYNILKIYISVDNRKVILYSNYKNELEGNLLCIYNQLLKKNLNIKIFLKRKTTNKISLLYDLVSAKYIIIDDFVPLLYTLKLRKETKFIQVWHAIGLFKNFGFARLGRIGGPKNNSLIHKNYTDVIISSTEILNDYAKSFRIDKNKIKALGIPRSDLFFNKNWLVKKQTEFFKKIPHAKGKKIILYAPTFRGNGAKSAFFYKDFLNIDELYQEFKNEYIFLIKIHPFVTNKIKIKPAYNKFIFDISEQSEVNNFLPVCDILITDYSSVIFEYSLLKKPLILYVPDLNNYIKERGFYYSFNSYNYGQIAKNTNELIKAIKNPKVNNRKIEILQQKHMNKCDGHATKRFIDEFFKNNI